MGVYEAEIPRYQLSLSGTAEDDDSEEYIPRLRHSARFAALLQYRLYNSLEPANPPSAWPFLYAAFFETLREDEFEGSNIHVEYVESDALSCPRLTFPITPATRQFGGYLEIAKFWMPQTPSTFSSMLCSIFLCLLCLIMKCFVVI